MGGTPAKHGKLWDGDRPGNVRPPEVPPGASTARSNVAQRDRVGAPAQDEAVPARRLRVLLQRESERDLRCAAEAGAVVALHAAAEHAVRADGERAGGERLDRAIAQVEERAVTLDRRAAYRIGRVLDPHVPAL